MKHLSSRRSTESGMASMIVTFILIFVITIVVMGFSVVIQRNERQVIDRNLSARAFYAAEAGVNTAIHKIDSYPNGKPSCDADLNNPKLTTADYTIDAASSTQVTCLTIDNTPTSLVYDSIAKETSQVIPFNSVSGNISSIDFNWEDTVPKPGYNYPSCPNKFPADDGSWNCPPLLRIDLVPSAGSLNRDGLLNSVFTIFAYPSGANGITVTSYENSQGKVINGKCAVLNAPRQCRIQIGGLRGTSYTARVMSLYGDMALTVCANGGPADSCNIQLKGVQAIVDSTARAMDVVRRIQVRYKLAKDNITPSSTIQTAAGLCKRYGVIPSTGTVDIQSVGGADSGGVNSACTY